MYTISKRFSFDASHHLEGLPTSHKCGRVHGHTYVIELVLQSDVLIAPGFVVDYGKLVPFKEYLDAQFDHRDLNEVIQPVQPTAENIARLCFEWCKARWPETIAVRVSETPNTLAEYTE